MRVFRDVGRVLIFTLGAVFLPNIAIADEKKSPSNPKDYDLKCTVRHWDGKKFLKPIPNQPAMKGELEGKMVIYTMPQGINVRTPKGSEITIGDGTYVVERAVEGSAYHTSYVKLKPKGK